MLALLVHFVHVLISITHKLMHKLYVLLVIIAAQHALQERTLLAYFAQLMLIVLLNQQQNLAHAMMVISTMGHQYRLAFLVIHGV